MAFGELEVEDLKVLNEMITAVRLGQESDAELEVQRMRSCAGVRSYSAASSTSRSSSSCCARVSGLRPG